jgi:hypothetical protein
VHHHPQTFGLLLPGNLGRFSARAEQSKIEDGKKKADSFTLKPALKSEKFQNHQECPQ